MQCIHPRVCLWIWCYFITSWQIPHLTNWMTLLHCLYSLPLLTGLFLLSYLLLTVYSPLGRIPTPCLLLGSHLHDKVSRKCFLKPIIPNQGHSALAVELVDPPTPPCGRAQWAASPHPCGPATMGWPPAPLLPSGLASCFDRDQLMNRSAINLGHALMFMKI